MQIYIAPRNQDVVPIQIVETATVYDLKIKIFVELRKVEMFNQIFIFKSQVLLESGTMKQYGIKENSVIELREVKRENGNQKVLMKIAEIHGSDMLNDGMESNIEITLQWCSGPSGRCQKSSVALSTNVKLSQVKDYIETYCKIPSEFQILYFNGQILNNDEDTIIDLGIRDQTTIQIRKKEIQIFIQTTILNPNIFTLHVLPSEKIEDVKGKIECYIKCNPIDQTLFLNGMLLDDCDILREKRITTTTVLDLFITPRILRLNIQIKYKQLKPILCETTASFGQLKVQLEKAENISKSELYLNDNKIDDQRLLMECGINEMSYLTLVNRKDIINITIRGDTKEHRTEMYNADTVKDLKGKIFILTGIPINLQILHAKLANGTIIDLIDDSKEIKTYIYHSATVYVYNKKN